MYIITKNKNKNKNKDKEKASEYQKLINIILDEHQIFYIKVKEEFYNRDEVDSYISKIFK